MFLGIQQLFEKNADKFKNKIALVSGETKISFKELNERADKLAFHLRNAESTESHDVICILMDKTIDFIVSMISALKIGKAFLPLDPSYPINRLKYILDESGAHTILANNDTYETAKTITDNVLNVENINDVTGEERRNQTASAFPLQPAYIIYTSGSTGTPKGVIATHYGAIAVADTVAKRLGISDDDNMISVNSHAFAYTYSEILCCLLHGNTLVLMKSHEARDMEKVYNAICSNDVKILHHTPRAFEQLISYADKYGDGLNLKNVILAGEAPNFKKLYEWKRQNRSTTVIANLYGLSELVGNVAIFVLDNEADTTIKIGKPMPDIDILLLNDKLERVENGEVGEICIASKRVAFGYLHRPDLTVEKFVANPYGCGDRIYRTGDLGLLCSDGNIEYLGRMDTQAKVNGFRVEMKEIDETLQKIPLVKCCCTVLKKQDDDTNFIVSFVVLKNNARSKSIFSFTSQADQTCSILSNIDNEGTIDIIYERLKSDLPSYMIPSFLVFLDEMPLTPNGKLDRFSLSKLDINTVSENLYIPPKTEMEKILCNVFAKVLSLPRIGITNNFFRVGCDSIKAIKLVSQLREKDVNTSVQQIFQYPTIAELARNCGTFNKTTSRKNEFEAEFDDLKKEIEGRFQ